MANNSRVQHFQTMHVVHGSSAANKRYTSNSYCAHMVVQFGNDLSIVIVPFMVTRLSVFSVNLLCRSRYGGVRRETLLHGVSIQYIIVMSFFWHREK